MSYSTPVVSYSATSGGTYTALTGVQSATISRGRQRFQDPIQSMVLTVELIPATSYALPLARGQFIDVRASQSSTADCYFQGKISEIKRDFAIPYNNVTNFAPADRITITATAAIGQVAAQFQSYSWSSFPQPTVTNLFGIQVFNANVQRKVVSSTVKAIGATGSGYNWNTCSQLLRTVNYESCEMDNNREVVPGWPALQAYPTGHFWDAPLEFSDAGGAGPYKYVGLEYVSSLQDTFTSVIVESPTLADQTATVGSPPFNSLEFSTFCESTSTALDLAQFVLATNSTNALVPFSVICDTTVDSSVVGLARMPSYADPTLSTVPKSIIGAPVEITFRGTTVLGAIKGTSIAFYPDRARVQVFVAPFEYQFQLDSTTLGVLDQNKLGF
jgi:hypothetical protein